MRRSIQTSTAISGRRPSAPPPTSTSCVPPPRPAPPSPPASTGSPPPSTPRAPVGRVHRLSRRPTRACPRRSSPTCWWATGRRTLSQPRARLSTWLAKPYAAASTGRDRRARRPGGRAPPPPAGHPRPATYGSRWPRRRRPARRPAVPVYELHRPTASVLDAVRLPPPTGDEARVLRRILDNAHGKLANTWREGLIRWPAPGHHPHQEAGPRRVIRQAAPWAEDVTPWNCPSPPRRTCPPRWRLRYRHGPVQDRPDPPVATRRGG